VSLLSDPCLSECAERAKKARRALVRVREDVVMDSVWYEDAPRGIRCALPKKLLLALGPEVAFEWALMRQEEKQPAS